MKLTIIPFLLCLFVLSASGGSTPIESAVAVIHPTVSNQASGTVLFREKSDGVHLKIDIRGLTPGKHGFHVHKFGDCSANNGASAGGHFDPHGMNHGGPGKETRHIGDLGNITADEDGRALIEKLDNTVSLNGEQGIIGRAIIIHAKPDDLHSQPTGAAGPRVGCGVIGISH